MGLAARAGRVVSGTDAVRKAVRDGEVKLVLLAADSALPQQNKLIPLLEARGVRFRRFGDRDRLGSAIGRGPVAAVGISDANFSQRMSALLAELEAPQDRV